MICITLQVGKAGGEKWKSMSEAVRYKRLLFFFFFLFFHHIHYSNFTNNTIYDFYLRPICGQIVMRFGNFILGESSLCSEGLEQEGRV